MATKSSKKLKQKMIDSHLSSQQTEHLCDQDGAGTHGSPTYEAETEDILGCHSSESSIPATNASNEKQKTDTPPPCKMARDWQQVPWINNTPQGRRNYQP
ncbi:Hypothetical predicted protein [Pelobates cultripes]|uniref:Uncharacterized protein n=1 Tax=Pelobates cultripes TaxID=61616 RepID=A0AAD1R828_PELCU|nr:Hypothetical predicted protein [Pelobates cultripes]